jgi:hypothetical protein
MSSKIKILMIDDQEDVYKSLYNYADDFGIELYYSRSTDDAEDQLKNSKGIVGVIIDAVGIINKDDPSGQGKEKDNFLIETIRRLDVLEKELDFYYAKCVYTAFYDRYKSLTDQSTHPVFSKTYNPGHEKNEMFTHLIHEITKNDFYRISRGAFPDVFNCIGSVFFKENKSLINFYNEDFTKNDAFDHLLYSLCKKAEKGEYDEDLYNLLRQALEFLLISIRDFGVPDEFYKKNGEPEQWMCLKYIEGKDVNNKDTRNSFKSDIYKKKFPKIIQYCFRFLKDVSNDKSHLIKKQWNKYLLISIINCFFEIILWLSKNKENTIIPVFSVNNYSDNSKRSISIVKKSTVDDQLFTDKESNEPAVKPVDNNPQNDDL